MKNKNISNRTFFIFFLILILYLSTIFYLFYLSIIKGNFFKKLAEKNCYRYRFIDAPRGNILDKNNNIIAESIKKFRLIVLLKKKKQLFNFLNDVENLFFYKKEKFEKKIKNNPFSIIKIFDNIHELNQWKYNSIIEKNSFLEEFWIRKNNPIFNHVIGFLSNNKPIQGLEKSFDNSLRGNLIIHKIYINNCQNIIFHEKDINIIPGKDLKTTLCTKSQTYVFNKLKNYSCSVVIMNSLGEILVNFSSPLLKVYEEYSSKNYFLNKTLQEKYMPGSIFKIISLISLIKLNKKIDFVICKGFLKIANQNFYCWCRSGHGIIDSIEKAFQKSCNIFFYKNCYRFDEYKNYFFETLDEFGFQKKTQNDFPSEINSKIISPKNKIQMMLMSIGQGFANTTTMQNCQLILRLIEKKRISPIFVKKSSLLDYEKLSIDEKILNFLEKCLFSIFSNGGNCSNLYNEKYDFFGKTGTAQIMSLNKKNYKKEHAHFIGGEKKSKLFIAITLENSGFGINAAKIAIDILIYMIENKLY